MPSFEVPLNGLGGTYLALIDEADRELVESRGCWYAHQSGSGIGKIYAARYDQGKRTTMHRLLCPADTLDIDHINGNTLDNRRENLRPAFRSQNQANQRHARGKSGFKGVFPTKGERWMASIGYQYKLIYLGTFGSPEEAARAYDKKAIELHGDFACTNEMLGKFNG
jgi:hypothetical protein